MPEEQKPPQQPPAPPPPSSGKSFFWWLVVFIVIGGGGYSYTQGWLDKPLALLVGQTQTPAASPTATAEATTAPAVVATTENEAHLIAQLEAMQARLNSQEGTARNLQAIIEDLAEQVVRQSGDQPLPATAMDLTEMKLEIIDLRLRLTGDTLAAMRSLEQMEMETDPESSIGLAIIENRQRLSQIPTRDQVIAIIDQLKVHAQGNVEDVDRRLMELEAENNQASMEGGILNALFKVKKTDKALLLENSLAHDLHASIEPAKTALLLGDRASYLAALAEIQQAADVLRNHNSSLGTSEMAKLLSDLAAIGFPMAYLDLAVTGNT